jgi:hypothetical protein
MRLTLRTLLAYLDDTLPPAEIKEIGLKVAESDAAQELIARIKQVTRRRRLTTPPATGPDARFDPNTIAEYLDNLLSPEQVAEVEKTCLESDVHLAEIAACHQILTLVLGEPALVPPTARQRMYGLVRGREAVPGRRAAVTTANGAGDPLLGDTDDNLLGLPQHSASWLRWALPLAALVLLGVLAVIGWNSLSTAVPTKTVAQKADNGNPDPGKAAPVDPGENKGDGNKADPSKADPPKKEPDPIKKDQEQPKQEADPVKPAPVELVAGKYPLPSEERREIGRYVLQAGPTPSLLLTEPDGKPGWQRVQPDGMVGTRQRLLALPGYHGVIRTTGGVQLRLAGNVPEFVPLPLLESAVVVYAPRQPVDLEFTLDRGRVLVANEKMTGPANVRVRFHREVIGKQVNEEVWDLTLDEGGEVGLELAGRHTSQTPFGSGLSPLAELNLVVLKGTARVKVGYQTFTMQGPPGPGLLTWNNVDKGVQGPVHLKEVPVLWAKSLPRNELADRTKRAIDELFKGFANEKVPVEVTLQQALKSEDSAQRVLAILCMGAIDDLSALIDALGDEDGQHSDVRLVAIHALRHWLGRNDEQQDKLYDSIRNKGALLDKKYSRDEAETVMTLLHGFTDQQRGEPETYESLIANLRHNKIGIRELAYWHLIRMVPQGRAIPYDPAGTTDQRQFTFEQWKKLVPEGKLPPTGQATPAAGGKGTPMPK